jgi:tRNA (guanine6-N2)-methyltransferase
MTELELTTNVGLESFVIAEWLERGADLPGCDAGLTPGRAAGRVRIRADTLQDDVVERALEMRTVHHVLRMVEEFSLSPEAPLDDIRRRLAEVALPELAEETTSFRVTSERTGTHDFTSIDVQHAAGAGVLDQMERPVRMKGFDVEVRCDVRHDWVKVSVQLTRRSLAKRHERPFRPRVALKANVAWAMLGIARPPELPAPKALLDPCCGSGTLLLEAADRWGDCVLLGSDTSEMCVDGTRENFAQGPHSDRLHVGLADARALDAAWEGHPVDTVVSNLPFGRRLGQRINHYWFAVDLLSAIARLTEPGARVVLLTDRRRDLNTAVGQTECFTVRFVRIIDMGGIHPGIFLLDRLDAPAPPPRERPESALPHTVRPRSAPAESES